MNDVGRKHEAIQSQSSQLDTTPPLLASSSHTESPSHLSKLLGRLDVRVTFVYAVSATLWILLSDTIVGFLFAGNPTETLTISVWKGWGFVLLTSLALFGILSTELRKRAKVEQSEREQRQFAEAMRDSLVALTSSLDVNTVMSHILDQAANVLTYDGASILKFDAYKIIVVFSKGFPAAANTHTFDLPKTGAWPTHFAAIKAGQPYLINDTEQVSDWTKSDFTGWIRSSIGVPIVMHDKNIVGVLSVDSATPNRYTSTDVGRLQTFAHYAALTLENAYYAEQLEERVTERTTELQAAKDRTEAVLNNSMDSILVMNADLRIQQTNSAFNTLFGGQPSDYFGQPLVSMIDPQDVEAVTNTIETVIKNHQGQHIESRMRRKDGTAFEAEFSVGFVVHGDRQGYGLVGTIRDISQRKAHERQMRYHASLQENVTDAVISTDMQFHIQSWNKAAQTIYGWSAEEVLGKYIDDVLKTKFTTSETAERVVQDFLTKGYWTDEVIQQHRDGSSIDILSSTVLFKNEDGVPFGMVAVNHNISARKKMEQALRDALAKEKELNELKSRFVSMASHEFRTPLATLLAMTDTLSHYRHKMTPEQIEDRFQKMRIQIGRLTEFMDDVLSLTKMQAKKAEFNPTQLNVNELCRDVISEFQGRPDLNHQISFASSHFDCQALLDRKLMWHLLNNLLSNAIKYSAEGTTIDVGLTCQNECVTLTVQDQGIGIPEADMKRLFEPFHRAVNVGSIVGTGLGLVIVKESVDLHGGTLSVTSQVGVGTTVTVRLPIAQARSQPHDA